ISELKANPIKTLESGNGEAVAILNHNKPAFYCVPVEAYEKMQRKNSPVFPNWTRKTLAAEIKKRSEECRDGTNTTPLHEGMEELRQKLFDKL
ncbi:MAG: hypothetical protein HAW58_06665, partial [Candidatus Thioglobus sp.]|nr:hypothetical protein [Candidatus Thioglobus sp.]